MAGPSIYDLLAQQQISELTVANLNKATESTAIDSKNVDFWSGMITIARAMEESRTFAHGLPIPESGTVLAAEIGDGVNITYTPPGTEVWQVLNVDSQGCTVALKDSDGNMCQLQDVSGQICHTSPLYLSATMSIFFLNGSGSPKSPALAYLKVAL